MKHAHCLPSLLTRSVIGFLTLVFALSATAISPASRSLQQTSDEAAQAQAEKANEDATALRKKGDFPGAVERLKSARELYRQLHNSKAEADTLRRLGEMVYLIGKDNDEALTYFSQALMLDRLRGDQYGEGLALFSSGLVRYKSGDKKGALKDLEEALAKLTPGLLGNSEGELYTTLADCYLAAGDQPKAIAAYQVAFNFWQAKDQLRAALIAEQLGTLDLLNRNNSEAAEYLTKARKLWHDLKDEKREARVFLSLAKLSERLGDYAATVSYFEQARVNFHAARLDQEEGTTLSELASFYGSIGDLERARRYYLAALPILRRTEGYRATAWTNVNLASIYHHAGDFPSGQQRLREAIGLFEGLEDYQGIADAFFDLGINYMDEGDKRRALEFLKQSLVRSSVINDIAAKSRTLGQMGRIYAAQHDRKNATESIAQQIVLGEAVTDSKLKALVFLEIGISYSSLDDSQAALTYYQQALDLFRSTGDRKGAADALAGRALAQEKLGDLPASLKSYLESISIVEQVRTATHLEELQTTIAAQNANNYQNAVSLSMRLNQPQQAFELSERARARTLLDQFGNVRIDPLKNADAELVRQAQALRAELSALERQYSLARSGSARDLMGGASGMPALAHEIDALRNEYDALLIRLKASNPEYVSMRTVDPLPLAEVQKVLDHDTTLISYFITPDKTQAFIITRSSFQAVSLSVSESALRAAVNEFRGFADTRNANQQNLKKLYEWLINPLKPYLKTPLIGIVPNRVLHYLPFAALTDGKRFFGEDYELFYLPSTSIIPFIQRKRKAEISTLFSISYGQPEGMPRLSYADFMATEIAKLYQTTAVVGPTATETTLRSRAAGSEIIFVAAHGRLNTISPLFSRIVLAPDKENDGMLEVHEVYLLDLKKTGLVVLSSCQTQLGQQSRGDDIVGLNRAFIYAGAPTVIASLWSVKEQATSDLMISFFKNLKKGMRKTAALQAAQAQTRLKYPASYFWAGFVLTGDPD